MSSRKAKFDDDLGALIRETLQEAVDRQPPAKDVWRRIAQRINDEINRAGETKEFRRWSIKPYANILTLSTALVILIVSLIWPHRDRVEPQRLASLPSSAIQFTDGQRYSEIDVGAIEPILLNDVMELNELKQFQRSQQIRSLQDRTIFWMMPPADVLPHPLSDEGRLLTSTYAKTTSTVDERILKALEAQIR